MNSCRIPCCSRRCWVLTGAALVYFIAFPEDAAAVLAPLRAVLSLSYDVSPWLYGLAAVALACWTVRAVWGRGE
jgi:hypothetical protein